MELETPISPELIHSRTVENVIQKLGRHKTVSSVNLAREIFTLHPEYADGTVEKIQLRDIGHVQPVEKWIMDVKSLFEADSSSSDDAWSKMAVVDGRVLIIGLCLLDAELLEQLQAGAIFGKLVGELQGPLTDILSSYGSKQYERIQSQSAENVQTDQVQTQSTKDSESQSGDYYDTVPTWADDPITRADEDLLGRAAFARFLAERIIAVPRDSCAYSVHIFGPWGAGKSTLLNFLRKELENRGPDSTKKRSKSLIRKYLQADKKLPNEWLVVQFNAWLNQHIQPPWWTLMECVFRETKRRLSPWQRIQEYSWRFNSGRLHYFLGIVILAWLLALLVFGVSKFIPPETATAKALTEDVELISKAIVLITTILGGIFAIKRSLLFSSAQAAQTYTELTYDPTGQIKRRFNGLIKKLQPARVAILIDDLDRCQGRYVVELLEGMQTLFRDAPVIFVIAADRNWLNACYEDVYEKIHPKIDEPGKPLGSLFLEKAFRFSTPMPGIPEQLKKGFWEHLLRLKTPEGKADLAAARIEANNILSNAESETQLRNVLDDDAGRSFAEQRALREEAAVLLASPKIIERIEHTLKPYADLLEPNPRSMKLLVNNYSANRALSILSEVKIELHQLALWTILNSRWPQLADYLVERPEGLENIEKQTTSAFPENLKTLITEREVISVVRGASTNKPLTKATLKQCLLMRS